MISNLNIEEIANNYNRNVVVVMKDELKNIHPASYENYNINLQLSNIGNGSHWMALTLENKQSFYFDSYGYLPPQEIISFGKRIKKSNLADNKRQIHDRNQISSFFIF